MMPNIVWVGSPNFGYPRGRTGQLQPEAIVYHIAQGPLSAIDSWFNNPASEASSHFAVGLNGTVHQYVRLDDASWANGKVQNPDLGIPWLADCVQRGIAPTLRTITIEHEGYTGDSWPAAQYQASLALTRWLLEGQGLTGWLDDNLDHHFIGHCRIDSIDRARCPGTGWPRQRLFTDLKEDEMTKEEIIALIKAHAPNALYEVLGTPPATFEGLKRRIRTTAHPNDEQHGAGGGYSDADAVKAAGKKLLS